MNDRLECFLDFLDLLKSNKIKSLYILTDIICSDNELQNKYLWILEDDKLVHLVDLQIIENSKID